MVIALHHHLMHRPESPHVVAGAALTAAAAHARELHDAARIRLAAVRHSIRHGAAWLSVLLLPRRRPLPGVSVITPTWKRNVLLLNRAAPSVTAQTYPGEIEHIIVSDGPDPELAELVPGLHQLPVHHEMRNRGIVPRLFGTHQARHEIIAYLDDDNAWRPNHLELLVRALIGSNADFAYSRALCHDRDRSVRYTIGTPVPQAGQIDTSLLVHYRDLLTPVTWQPSEQPADWDLVSRWVAAGAHWQFVPDVTMDYYARPAATAVPVQS
jgi:Glycosyl transferase family 2